MTKTHNTQNRSPVLSTFEDDEEIVTAFTEYEEKKGKIDRLYRKLKELES